MMCESRRWCTQVLDGVYNFKSLMVWGGRERRAEDGKDMGRGETIQQKRRCYGNDALANGTSRDTPSISLSSNFPALWTSVDPCG